MSNSFILPIDRNLSGDSIPCLSGPGGNGNEGVLRIPQSVSITRASPSDFLLSYPRHSLRVGKSDPSVEMQLIFSPASVDWATTKMEDDRMNNLRNKDNTSSQ